MMTPAPYKRVVPNNNLPLIFKLPDDANNEALIKAPMDEID